MPNNVDAHEKGDILVVDDTPTSLKLLSGMLREEGYNARPVTSGALALQAALAQPPDLVLLDVTMSEMDGYEVCRRLKADPTLNDIPVLFISALTESIDKVKAFEVGGVDFVTKPFHFDEVRARVKTHLALHRLQSDLRKKYDELWRLQELRDNLTQMIVHDLRTPLSGVSAYLELLGLDSETLSPASQRYVKGAFAACQTMISMISSLLDVNRLEAGEMPLDKSQCLLEEVVAEAVGSLGGLAESRNLTVDTQSTPILCTCDPDVIRRVVANLVGNSLKCTPPSGSVVVRVQNRDGNPRIEVTDTGRGIPAGDLGRIFEKFAQVEARSEHKAISSGLGLTFCKLAVEAHGGAIGVQSEVGFGSTFWFELPAATLPAFAPAARDGAYTESAISRLSVLVVEDDPSSSEVMKEILRSLGLTRVRTAADGSEALQTLDIPGYTPEVITCDLNMPGMDGVEMIRHFAERNLSSALILVSGEDPRVLAAVDTLTRSHGLRVLGSLHKPIERLRLAEILRAYDQRPFRSAVEPITIDELKRGLLENAVELMFQPKVDVLHRKVCGVEALARWRHPTRGLLGPGTFVPLAEHSGLMHPLTRLIFRAAMNQCHQWLADGLELSVAVNFSMDDLDQIDLPEYITSCVKETQVPLSKVVMELTESKVMSNLRTSLETLSRLHLKGIRLSIDDFGTGYSSLEQLKRAPFSEMKIDRAFVRGAGEDPAARAILESSISLGKKLGMTVVAEGAETAEDLALVCDLGCDIVQGYVIAKPLPAARVLDWVKEWEADTHNAARATT